MKLTTLVALVCLAILAIPASAQQEEVPKNIADSVGRTLRYTEGQFLAIAEAMPEAKYSFIPSGGNFEGVRSFAEQVKHVACAQFAFFNEIEGKTPPEHCEKGGPTKAGTKAELVKSCAIHSTTATEFWPRSTRKTLWRGSRAPTPSQTRSSELRSPRYGTSPTTMASSLCTCE